MAKYVKRPVVIEAVQYTGNNLEELDAFIGDKMKCIGFNNAGERIVIHTLEGDMAAEVGDFIIRGVEGEFYPCKPDIFWKTYSAV